jgi:ectoine hydroxylase-related dioxygenase (phytanoyl-CoA dioxygenase family)
MKRLTERQVKQYHEEGATHPIRVFPKERAAAYLAELEKGEAQHGADFRRVLRTKAHLSLKWADELIHDPAVLDAVEDIIGPDIRLYNLTVWMKNARDVSYVGWHQDSTYFPLAPPVQITAWVALTDSIEDNGNVKYVPGSHKLCQLRHAEEIGKGSMLSKGQHVVEPFDSSLVKCIDLQPGEMSLHHTRLVHYSEPNHSLRRRIGMGISYIPTSVRCTGTVRHTAMLVRGKDDYNYWDDEPRVRYDFDPAVTQARESAIARYNEARDEQVALKSKLFALAS